MKNINDMIKCPSDWTDDQREEFQKLFIRHLKYFNSFIELLGDIVSDEDDLDLLIRNLDNVRETVFQMGVCVGKILENNKR